jgi:hypothetical protein
MQAASGHAGRFSCIALTLCLLPRSAWTVVLAIYDRLAFQAASDEEVGVEPDPTEDIITEPIVPDDDNEDAKGRLDALVRASGLGMSLDLGAEKVEEEIMEIEGDGGDDDDDDIFGDWQPAVSVLASGSASSSSGAVAERLAADCRTNMERQFGISLIFVPYNGAYVVKHGDHILGTVYSVGERSLKSVCRLHSKCNLFTNTKGAWEACFCDHVEWLSNLLVNGRVCGPDDQHAKSANWLRQKYAVRKAKA